MPAGLLVHGCEDNASRCPVLALFTHRDNSFEAVLIIKVVFGGWKEQRGYGFGKQWIRGAIFISQNNR
jgi:hypothetical protein